MHVYRPGALVLHGASAHHCVCNGTHLARGCWCNADRTKVPRPHGRLARLLAALFGGGRAPSGQPPSKKSVDTAVNGSV